MSLPLDGIEHWFGVKVWKSIREEGFEHPASVEESVIAVRATNGREARQKVIDTVSSKDESWINDKGLRVEVKVLSVEHVYDTLESRLRSGTEIFSRMYELGDDGTPELWPPEDT